MVGGMTKTDHCLYRLCDELYISFPVGGSGKDERLDIRAQVSKFIHPTRIKHKGPSSPTFFSLLGINYYHE